MKRIIFVICIFVAASLQGCATRQGNRTNVDTANINDLYTLTQQDFQYQGSMTSKIRTDALKDTALSMGAQGALSWRAAQLDGILAQSDKQLALIFNFNGLLLDHNILPPVIQESKQSLQLNSPNVIRASHHTYKILKQARFVTAAPQWRDYLWMNYPKPELPDSTLLPRNQDERDLWMKYITIGWRNGIQQANSIYADGLARLKTDFNGMILYRKLLSQNMVTKPYVAKTDLGITGDGSEMRISDQVLRITATPSLNADTSQWKPAIQHEREK